MDFMAVQCEQGAGKRSAARPYFKDRGHAAGFLQRSGNAGRHMGFFEKMLSEVFFGVHGPGKSKCIVMACRKHDVKVTFASTSNPIAMALSFYAAGKASPGVPLLVLLREPEDVRALSPVLGAAVAGQLQARLTRGARPALISGDWEIWAWVLSPGAQPDTQKEDARRAAEKAHDFCRNQCWDAVQYLSAGLGDAVDLAFVEGFALTDYQFLEFKDQDKAHKDHPERQMGLAPALHKAVETHHLRIKSQCWARDLVNTPPAHLTPAYFAQWMQRSLTPLGVKSEIIQQQQLQALKMGGLLGVNRGSQDPPVMAVFEWRPESVSAQAPPVVLVGKGVTYDTGGINLKQGTPMGWMKSDMGGAAAVAGALMGAASLKLPVRIIGLIPATDNRPGEKAMVPGDVLRMYDGSTVEVLNTDAEGRLILADAISYARKYKPRLLIDLATLTGSAARALGDQGAVYFSTAPDVHNTILEEAGRSCHERVWRFPLWPEYAALLHSDVAQRKNVGPPEAGAITAAHFLHHFAGDLPWMHLDIAGVAFRPSGSGYKGCGGSGFGVRLLLHFLEQIAQTTS